MNRAWGGALLVALLARPAEARDIDYVGYVESDLRLSLPGKTPPPGEDELRFLRSDNTARITTRIRSGKVRAFADVALIYRGLFDDLGLEDIETRGELDPFDIESDALYLQVSDFLVDGMEVKLGRQIIQWGTADKFNPTSVLNPLDLEDPIKFGDRVPNEMLVLSYTAPWYSESDDGFIWFDELTFTGVVVPIFRPHQLPRSAQSVFTDPDLFVQFVDSPTLRDFVDLQNLFIERGGTFSYDADVEAPSPALENVQYAGKIGATIAGVDLSAMYYRGFSDIAQARSVNAELSRIAVTGVDDFVLCGPDPDPYDDAGPPIDCPQFLDLSDLEAAKDSVANQLPEEGRIIGDVPIGIELHYPEIHAVGFDAATSLEFLGGVGVWAEAALVFHEAQTLTLTATGSEPFEETLIEEGSFWKAAAGADYSIFSWWYVNVQYLHGFVDEFGAENLEDYIVAGNDFKMFNDQLVLRLFGIINLQDQSWTGYPVLMSSFWPNTNIDLGALILEGEDDSKFGTRATGQSRVFLRGRYSF